LVKKGVEMKKIKVLLLLIVTLLIVLPSFYLAKDKIRLGMEGGYFSVGDEDFEPLYGSGGFTWGFNAGYMISGRIEIAAAVDFYSSDGVTSIFEEDISIDINHLRFGLAYHLSGGYLSPKVSAGLDYSWVKEDSPFGGFDDSGFGWFAGLGVEYMFAEKLLIGADIIYSSVMITGELDDEDVGGFFAMLSIKYLL
jgi:opacity protein-like surface antigen